MPFSLMSEQETSWRLSMAGASDMLTTMLTGDLWHSDSVVVVATIDIKIGKKLHRCPQQRLLVYALLLPAVVVLYYIISYPKQVIVNEMCHETKSQFEHTCH